MPNFYQLRNRTVIVKLVVRRQLKLKLQKVLKYVTWNWNLECKLEYLMPKDNYHHLKKTSFCKNFHFPCFLKNNKVKQLFHCSFKFSLDPFLSLLICNKTLCNWSKLLDPWVCAASTQLFDFKKKKSLTNSFYTLSKIQYERRKNQASDNVGKLAHIGLFLALFERYNSLYSFVESIAH